MPVIGSAFAFHAKQEQRGQRAKSTDDHREQPRPARLLRFVREGQNAVVGQRSRMSPEPYR